MPFYAFTILTLSAAIMVWLVQRFKFSPILGYLLLGVIAGPVSGVEQGHAYLFPDRHAIESVAEIGVVLLMFFIGLDFHLDQLRSTLALCLIGGSLQVGLTTAVSALFFQWLGVPLLAAIVMGIMVAMSSTALVMRSFEDRRELDSHRARVAFAVLLFQDFAAIFAVVALPLLSSLIGDGTTQKSPDESLGAAKQLGFLFIILPLLFFSARYVLPKLFETLARAPEAFSLFSLAACMSVALVAQLAGASMPLGAFLGGLVLCQTPFASQIRAELNTLRNLSLGLFFVSVGMLADLRFIFANAPILLLGLALLLILKAAATALALLAARQAVSVTAAVALTIAQIGEFSFVLGQQAQQMKILSDQHYRPLLAVAVSSMVLTPFLYLVSKPFAALCVEGSSRLLKLSGLRWLARLINVEPEVSEGVAAVEPAAPRAIVVGYGPVGRTLTRILRDFDVRPVVIDMNIETVKKLSSVGITAIYGDAGRREILEAAGVRDARYLLITLPDLAGRIPVVAAAHMLNPELKIFVRARYLAERAMLEEAGAAAVSYEEAEVAVALASFLLREMGAEQAAIEREALRIRNEIALRTGFTMITPAPRSANSK